MGVAGIIMKHSALIALQNIVKSYHLEGVSTQVLKRISLEVKPGEMIAIVGASGSGKSTLMNIIGLLDHADTGDYRLNNSLVTALNEDEKASLRNQHIGFVFQQFNLLTRFSALHNVALPLIYRQTPKLEIQEKVHSVLAKVGMDAYAHHKPTQLSGGQQQRVAIARALVGEPQVILADEPTGALDSKTGAEVMGLFHQLHGEGRTIILVTHDEQVASQCQRRIVLADGEIINEVLA